MVNACCGKTNTVFKIDGVLSSSIISQLSALGYKEHSHFIKAGILYMDNENFILSGPIGSDRLQAKCKHSDCSASLKDFEILLAQIG